MTIEKDKYDYTPYRAPNIVHKTKKGAAEQVPPGLEPQRMIAPLIDRLAKYHPDWMFVSMTGFADGATHIPTATKYWVYQGMEYLGYIGLGTRDYQTTIMLDSPRIAHLRRRGNGKQTGDVKKALKIVEEYFVGTTPAESMALLHNAVSNRINSRAADANSAFQTEFRPLADPFMEYAMENWDVVKAALKERGCRVSDTVDYVELHKQKAAFGRLHKYKNSDQGYLVRIDNGVYSVATGYNSPITLYQSDTLPAHLKTNLGMLKLLGKGATVPDIGVRISENEFFVVGEEA